MSCNSQFSWRCQSQSCARVPFDRPSSPAKSENLIGPDFCSVWVSFLSHPHAISSVQPIDPPIGKTSRMVLRNVLSHTNFTNDVPNKRGRYGWPVQIGGNSRDLGNRRGAGRSGSLVSYPLKTSQHTSNPGSSLVPLISRKNTWEITPTKGDWFKTSCKSQRFSSSPRPEEQAIIPTFGQIFVGVGVFRRAIIMQFM